MAEIPAGGLRAACGPVSHSWQYRAGGAGSQGAAPGSGGCWSGAPWAPPRRQAQGTRPRVHRPRGLWVSRAGHVAKPDVVFGDSPGVSLRPATPWAARLPPPGLPSCPVGSRRPLWALRFHELWHGATGGRRVGTGRSLPHQPPARLGVRRGQRGPRGGRSGSRVFPVGVTRGAGQGGGRSTRPSHARAGLG